MADETTCPTCGGPCTETLKPAKSITPSGDDWARTHLQPTTVYATTANPTRERAMAEYLRKTEWQGVSYDVGRQLHTCLSCGGMKEIAGHAAGCELAALLEGTDGANA